MKDDMEDQQLWNRACTFAADVYGALSPDDRDKLAGLTNSIMQLKREMLSVTFAAGSGGVCRDCGGECCRYGRYHFSVLDMLACFSANVLPPVPRFENLMDCPFGTDSGCSLDPGFRPVTCVIFNCERIEELMGVDLKTGMQRSETLLREAVETASLLLGMRVSRPLLLIVQ
ncbi:MAG TPA: hypothetical protein PLN25_11845, partial [Deltaproteobacteria bacterium]|nr:hypothetical protein [Deltaproteobacteria bacterium]